MVGDMHPCFQPAAAGVEAHEARPPNKAGGRRWPDWARRRVLALGAVVLVSCLSPTLPLPPPSRPNIEGPDATGSVTLSGVVRPGAHVYVDNLNSGMSVGQRADLDSGQYRFAIGAQVGDQLSMFYRLGTEESPSIQFGIPEPLVDAGGGGAAGAAGSSDGGADAAGAGP